MTSFSQNGWPVASKSDIHYYRVPGLTKTTIAFRQGSVAVVMLDLFTKLAKIEKPHEGWMWGWYVRPIRGQTTGYSNHASGTAGDYNAPLHGRQGTSRYLGWSDSQVRAIHNLLANRYHGLIRWGGDYSGPPTSLFDPMHFEIVGNQKQITALAAELVVANTPKPPVVTAGDDEVFIVSRSDEAEQYVTNGLNRRWIPDAAHRDLIVQATGCKIVDVFTTEAGMNAVGGPLVGPESPDKLARLAKGGK